jgi:hypothetical protein
VDGEIGRRTGLKILGTQVREGSSPSLRISFLQFKRVSNSPKSSNVRLTERVDIESAY